MFNTLDECQSLGVWKALEALGLGQARLYNSRQVEVQVRLLDRVEQHYTPFGMIEPRIDQGHKLVTEWCFRLVSVLTGVLPPLNRPIAYP